MTTAIDTELGRRRGKWPSDGPSKTGHGAAYPHVDRDPVRPLSIPYRTWLWLEMIALFVATPLLIYVLVYEYRQPLFIVLPAMFLVLAVMLTIDGRFIWRKILTIGVSFGQIAHITALFAILGAILILYADRYYPSGILRFYNAAPDLFWKIMILYPLLSASTQEIMYRVFFFHRYRELFGGQTWLLIWVNAILFAYAHIIFLRENDLFHESAHAIWLSLVAGLIFAWRYERTRSFWAVFIEHSIYGNLIFAIGFGRFFYTGISNQSWAVFWFDLWDDVVRYLGL